MISFFIEHQKCVEAFIGLNDIFSLFVAKSECIKWHEKKNIHVELYEEMICAGYKNKTVDACLGDRFEIELFDVWCNRELRLFIFSGGPLSVLDNGRYYLLGITSAGFDCARPLQPGIYHNVSAGISRAVIRWQT